MSGMSIAASAPAKSAIARLLESRGDYCIFLDGDCIARPDFVASHRALAERGWFVSGNRILMSQDLTRQVLAQHLEPENWNFASWVGRRSRNDINRLAPMLPLPLGPLRKLRPGEWQHARSCNLAVWRDDLDRVDGFDADYNGWGREDSDLLVRLLHAGVRRKDGNFATGVLHLWHPAADRSALPVNDKKLDRVRGEKRVKALARDVVVAPRRSQTPPSGWAPRDHDIHVETERRAARKPDAARRRPCDRHRAGAAVVDIGDGHPDLPLGAGRHPDHRAEGT